MADQVQENVSSPQASVPKKRAIEMDETLDMTADLTTAIENLTAKQQETALAMRKAKKRLKELQEQLAAYESEAAALSAEEEGARQAMKQQGDELSKAREEYASLNQSSAWTRSALDSALGAQEEYRKGYTNMRTELSNTKEELKAVNKELARCREAQQELQQLKQSFDKISRRAKNSASTVLGRMTDSSGGSLNALAYQAWTASLAEAKLDKEIEEAASKAKARLDEFLARNKATSRDVLDKLSAGCDAGLLAFFFAAWRKAAEDEKEEKLYESRVHQSKDRIQAFKQKRKDQAAEVLTRMSSASDSGLLSMVIGCWLLCVQEMKKVKEMEATMRAQEGQLREMMHKKSAEAKAVLARSLGSTVTGIMTQVLMAWSGLVQQEKRDRAMTADMQRKLKELQSKRKVEAMHVLEHIAGKRERELLVAVISIWISGASELKRKKQIEKEYREQCHQDMQHLSEELELRKEQHSKAQEQFNTKYVTGNERLRQEIAALRQELSELEGSVSKVQLQVEHKNAELSTFTEELEKSSQQHFQLHAEVKAMVAMHAVLEDGIDEVVRT